MGAKAIRDLWQERLVDQKTKRQLTIYRKLRPSDAIYFNFAMPISREFQLDVRFDWIELGCAFQIAIQPSNFFRESGQFIHIKFNSDPSLPWTTFNLSLGANPPFGRVPPIEKQDVVTFWQTDQNFGSIRHKNSFYNLQATRRISSFTRFSENLG
jgi:hypothetical protein